MKSLAFFVWYFFAAVLFFGVWAAGAMLAYALVLLLVGIFRPEWLKYL